MNVTHNIAAGTATSGWSFFRLPREAPTVPTLATKPSRGPLWLELASLQPLLRLIGRRDLRSAEDIAHLAAELVEAGAPFGATL